MNWKKLEAAIIRAFWTVVFPLIGVLVDWLVTGENLREVGVENAALILVVGGVLYGLKKYVWPDTRF